MMVSELLVNNELWRLLWSQTAHQIVANLRTDDAWELVSAGHGWGLRHRNTAQHALLLYPSGAGRERGDLSVMIRGQGTQTIPRHGHSYPSYLAAVEDVVTTVAESYLFAAR